MQFSLFLWINILLLFNFKLLYSQDDMQLNYSTEQRTFEEDERNELIATAITAMGIGLVAGTTVAIIKGIGRRKEKKDELRLNRAIENIQTSDSKQGKKEIEKDSSRNVEIRLGENICIITNSDKKLCGKVHSIDNVKYKLKINSKLITIYRSAIKEIK